MLKTPLGVNLQNNNMTTLPPPNVSNNHNPAKVWDMVLRSSLMIPGARVSREDYLRRELEKHLPAEQVKAAIETTPAKAGIPLVVVDMIATSSIK